MGRLIGGWKLEAIEDDGAAMGTSGGLSKVRRHDRRPRDESNRATCTSVIGHRGDTCR